jgi:hypothetical protein
VIERSGAPDPNPDYTHLQLAFQPRISPAHKRRYEKLPIEQRTMPGIALDFKDAIRQSVSPNWPQSQQKKTTLKKES